MDFLYKIDVSERPQADYHGVSAPGARLFHKWSSDEKDCVALLQGNAQTRRAFSIIIIVLS